jgi:methionine-rich copper-binding protein CopC
MKHGLRVLASLIAVFAIAATAHAHSTLDNVTPADGSTVRGSPKEVKITFSQPLEPAFSMVQVFDENGRQVDKKDKRVSAADTKVLTVSLPTLAPGSYHVVWRALAKDGHVTKGEFDFKVAK